MRKCKCPNWYDHKGQYVGVDHTWRCLHPILWVFMFWRNYA